MSAGAPRLPGRVLALAAHPDDIELLCAGTLARFLAAGSRVELAIACQGDRGGSNGPDPNLAARRRGEAERSAALLGAPIHFLGLGDAHVRDTPSTRRAVLDLIRRTRPELILTHGPSDYHDDHVRVGRLATKCAWYAASAGHRSEQPALSQPPAVFFMDNVAGIAFEPTHLVEITATMELKRQMLACHASQLARAGQGLPALADLAETLARLRGHQCGVAFAEGFRPAFVWGRRRPEPVFP